MLATKIIPSFYILEIEGAALKAIIPGNFGIEKISVSSRDFSNDLFALAALSDVMVNLTVNINLHGNDVNEYVEYNPEFFPSVPPLSASDKEEEDEADINDGTESMSEQQFDEMSGAAHSTDPQHYVLDLSRNFDPIGDFVETRWTIKASDFFIRGKIAVNPETYMRHKASDHLFQPRSSTSTSPSQRVHIH